MAVNLVDLAKNYLSSKVVDQVSATLGETPQNTQKAFDGALPTILNGLIQKSSESTGSGLIMDLLSKLNSPTQEGGNSLLSPSDIVSQLSNAKQSSGLLSIGSTIIQRLFGNKAGSVVESIASYSGVSQSSASSLMSLASPVLLSVLGKKMTEDGTGILGLGSLLSSQTAAVQSALPSGLGALLGAIPGLGMVSGLKNKVADLTSEIGGQATRIIPPVMPAFSANDDHSSGSGRKWLPWLLLLLGLAALFYFVRSCGKEQKAVSESVEISSSIIDSTISDGQSVADSAGSMLGAAVDSAGSAVHDAASTLGDFFKLKLPSGVELNIPENGIENNLVKFIEDTDKPADKTTWFNFGRLLFETGKSTLKAESKEEVKNMAEILKAFPGVNIKIGGYTDNTGNNTLNKKLSQERASAVKGELVHLGIDQSRLAAEGYGSEHPVASNDTESGRTQNRRIAIRVTKK